MIAEFLGWNQQTDPTERFFGDWFDNYGTRRTQGVRIILTFHSDWNELMPVVEKIEKLDDGKFDVAILQDGTQIMIWDTRTKIVDITNAVVYFESKIEATYKAVVEFIKWYNENK